MGIKIRKVKGTPARVVQGGVRIVGTTQRRRAPPEKKSIDRSPLKAVLISVLIPAYRTPELCIEAIDSVLSQDLPKGWRIEILVGVDACAPTLKALKQENYDPRVQIVEFAANKGPYRCLNGLLRRSSGDPIMILDSDDRMLPDRIKRQLGLLFQFDFVGALHSVTEDGVVTRPGTPSSPSPSLFSMDYPLHSTWAARRYVYAQLDGYQGWRCGADTDFLLRVVASGYRIHVFQQSLAVRRLRRGQMTAPGSPTGPGTSARKHAQASVAADLAAYRIGAPVRKIGSLASRSNPVRSVHRRSPRTVAVMPTLPRRATTASAVARSLLKQGVDELVVHLQGHAEVPAWASVDRVTVVRNPAGTGPISRWSQIPDDAEVVLSVDDDLFYPDDYVDRMVDHLLRLGPGSAVSLHCSHWPPGRTALDDRVILDFSMAADSYIAKSYMGCGVAAFFGDDLRRVDRIPASTAFDRLDDVWMSAAIARAGLKLYRPPSRSRWVRSTPAQADGIYAVEVAEQFASRRKAIATARAMGPWPLTPPHASLRFEEIR